MIPTPAEVMKMNSDHEIRENLRMEEARKLRLELDIQNVSIALFRVPMKCPVSQGSIHKDVAEGVAEKAHKAGWAAEVTHETIGHMNNDYTYSITILGPA